MNICVATTSRSDFGLIKNLIFELKKSNFKVQVIVGGSHFLKEFGNTFNEIINCGIKIDKKNISLNSFQISLHPLFMIFYTVVSIS